MYIGQDISDPSSSIIYRSRRYVDIRFFFESASPGGIHRYITHRQKVNVINGLSNNVEFRKRKQARLASQ